MFYPPGTLALTNPRAEIRVLRSAAIGSEPNLVHGTGLREARGSSLLASLERAMARKAGAAELRGKLHKSIGK